MRDCHTASLCFTGRREGFLVSIPAQPRPMIPSTSGLAEESRLRALQKISRHTRRVSKYFAFISLECQYRLGAGESCNHIDRRTAVHLH